MMESTSTEEAKAEIVNLADAKKERFLSSREGKLMLFEQAHDDFFRAHTETRRTARTTIQRVDEAGVTHVETIPGLSGGSHGGDCISVTTNAKSTRPRLVALEIAMNKIERVIFAIKRNQWEQVPKDPADYIERLWQTIPPVVDPSLEIAPPESD